MCADLNNLDLIPEELPEIDYTLMEAGSGFPPQVPPAERLDFIFKLGPLGNGDEGERLSFEAVEMKEQKCLQVNFAATTTVSNGNGESKEATLNFQRANTFLSDKMRKAGMNHSLGELFRALGIKLEGPLTKAKIIDSLTEASAQGKHFPASTVWRRYCKSCELTISTNPNSKKGDIKWPRGADGKPELLVACPKCGSKNYGNAEIDRFKLPEGSATGSAPSGSSGISI